MRFLDRLFGSVTAPPATPAPVAPSLALKAAPTFHPVPANSVDPLDAEVLRLWDRYQRGVADPTWDKFCSWLVEANIALDRDIAEVRRRLANYNDLPKVRP
ncbi:MAG TPA: hypothetical protein PK264_01880 [Hyphomicrobiaceae bacterium]|nr:hypothetical protein [Hyphomicrobiaceae bacterium]